MNEPMKCKYCGAAAATAEGKGWLAACGSWDFGYGLWSRGEGCYLRSKVAECDELRKQVREAAKRLAALDRVNFYDDANYVWNAIAVTQILLKKAVGDA
jgi:hypothetical protein